MLKFQAPLVFVNTAFRIRDAGLCCGFVGKRLGLDSTLTGMEFSIRPDRAAEVNLTASSHVHVDRSH